MNRMLVQQLVLGGASIALGVLVVVLLRRGRLTFALGAIWFVLVLAGVAAALSVPFVASLGALLGVVPAAVFAGVVGGIVGLAALALSVRHTHLENQVQDLAERLATDGVSPPLPTAQRSDEILAIVPAFNEEATIRQVVTDLLVLGLRVLVVDDGSADRTARFAALAGASVAKHPTNLGVGAAIRTAFRCATEAGYERVVQCDADGQHPSESVSAVVTASRREDCRTDLLIGSRFAGREPAYRTGVMRRVAIWALSASCSRAAGTRLTDVSSGLRVIRGQLLHELSRWMPRHYLGDTYEVVLAAGRAGYIIAEIPVAMEERAVGVSSASTTAAVGATLRSFGVLAIGTHHRLASPMARNDVRH